MLRYSSRCADAEARCYDDFDIFIDQVHALFEEMQQSLSFSPGDDALQHAKLVVHEWLANLVQHADFEERAPEIIFGVTLRGAQVQIAIQDNSCGFDLDAQLQLQEEVLAVLPSRGMGLLVIQACTEDLTYQRLARDLHCLTFSVSAGQYLVLHLPFLASGGWSHGAQGPEEGFQADGAVSTGAPTGRSPRSRP